MVDYKTIRIGKVTTTYQEGKIPVEGISGLRIYDGTMVDKEIWSSMKSLSKKTFRGFMVSTDHGRMTIDGRPFDEMHIFKDVKSALRAAYSLDPSRDARYVSEYIFTKTKDGWKMKWSGNRTYSVYNDPSKALYGVQHYIIHKNTAYRLMSDGSIGTDALRSRGFAAYKL